MLSMYDLYCHADGVVYGQRKYGWIVQAAAQCCFCCTEDAWRDASPRAAWEDHLEKRGSDNLRISCSFYSERQKNPPVRLLQRDHTIAIASALSVE